jgi:prevent-host-death family protein
MEAFTYTSARKNMAKLMTEVCENSDVKIITRANKPAVVMMSLEDYNSFAETHYLLSNPNNAGHLRESLKQLEEGDLVHVSLEEL